MAEVNHSQDALRTAEVPVSIEALASLDLPSTHETALSMPEAHLEEVSSTVAPPSPSLPTEISTSRALAMDHNPVTTAQPESWDQDTSTAELLTDTRPSKVYSEDSELREYRSRSPPQPTMSTTGWSAPSVETSISKITFDGMQP